MKLKSFQSFFIGLGLTGLTTIASLSISISPGFSQANSSDKPNKVTFFCREVVDEANGEKIPATVAWIPDRQGNVNVIGWKSDYFSKSGWTPQKRCQEVTEKIQKLYLQDRFNYLSHGMHNGYPIICGLANQGEACNGNNQLFTVKLGANPELVLHRLMDIREGKASDMLLQGSGGQTYISVQNFLSQAPMIREGN